jgi:hypothetical protein
MTRAATALALLLFSAPSLAAEIQVRDYTPEGWVRQPSFVSNGGMLAKNEHAFIAYVDATVLPPAVMAGYRYGIFYWWDVGLEIGGSHGVFQALLHLKMENLKTFETELFFWANRIRTGFKHHEYGYTDELLFEDRSWIFSFDNTFSFRLGSMRRQALYLTSTLYIDIDLHTPRRQTDYYVMPAMLGFETMIGSTANFFVEAGFAISLNGMQTHAGILYTGDLFPVATLGVAYRTGERTAIYYVPQTKDKAKLR